MSSILDNVKYVQEEIEKAAQTRGSSLGDISLVCATKTQTSEKVQEAIGGGIHICGENRVQEMLEKQQQGAYHGAKLHFIGHLQKNKVRKVLEVASLVQSVDSLELIQSIDRIAGELGKKQEILLQVNIGQDDNKFGFDHWELPPILENCGEFSNILVKGLMTMPPFSANLVETRGYFAKMYQVFVDIMAKKYHNVNMDYLSMGLSHDFREAILEGANMVRVGTAVFGQRD